MTDPVTPKRRPVSHATRQWVKERDKFRCVDCNTHENLTVDHIVPVAMGGTNDVENLTTRCQTCNSKKGVRSVEEHLSGVARTRQSSKRTPRINSAAERAFSSSSLVGSFFLGDIKRPWQGVIVAEVAPQVYLVEIFEWFMGCPWDQSLIPLEEMSSWTFYDDETWMRNQYENSVQLRWEDEREQEKQKNNNQQGATK